MGQARRSDGVRIVEAVALDCVVVGSDDLRPHLAGTGSPLPQSRPHVQMEAVSLEGEGTGHHLAERIALALVTVNAVQRDEPVRRRHGQADGSQGLVPQVEQALGGSPIDSGVVVEQLPLVDLRVLGIDHGRVEAVAGSGRYEGLPVVPVVVDAVAAEDGLGQDAGVGGPEVPEHAHVHPLIDDDRHVVELEVRIVLFVREDNRFGPAPVDHVGAFRPADEPLSQGTAKVGAVLHVHGVGLADGVPAHEDGGPPAPYTGRSVDDGIVLVGRPLEAVG